MLCVRHGIETTERNCMHSSMAAEVTDLNLRSKVEEAKQNLKNIDDNIRKKTGREPITFRGNFRGGRGGGQPGPLNRNRNDENRRERNGGVAGIGIKRIFDKSFPQSGKVIAQFKSKAEDNDWKDDDMPKKGMQSSVVAAPKEVKTRRACIQEQKSDRSGQKRNTRMFGFLMGTLQKFKSEEDVNREKEARRAEIEHKLDAKAEEERENAKRERQELFRSRKKQQLEILKLERKCGLTESFQAWKRSHLCKGNFVKTKASPSIFFLPKLPMVELEDRLRASKQEVEEDIAVREEELRKTLERIDRPPTNHHEEEIEDTPQLPLDYNPLPPMEEQLPVPPPPEAPMDVEAPIGLVEMQEAVTVGEVAGVGEVVGEVLEGGEVVAPEVVGQILGETDFEPIYD